MLLLIIDDDYVQRAFYKHHLELAGDDGVVFWPDGTGVPTATEVEQLRNGRVITDIATVNVSDISAVLLDYRLHTVTCRDVIEAIRTTADPVLFIATGFPEDAVFDLCMEYSATYVSKQTMIERPEHLLRMINDKVKKQENKLKNFPDK